MAKRSLVGSLDNKTVAQVSRPYLSVQTMVKTIGCELVKKKSTLIFLTRAKIAASARMMKLARRISQIFGSPGREMREQPKN